MSMTAEITASTDGGDDAEALAQALEHLAARIRSAGGYPVRDSGSIAVRHGHGVQDVHFGITAAP